ncbi:MAG: DNA-3-methyladenine glycosylase 2 [Dehalococcoidia bacterium]|nr:DNA-3-methyladenine glycosylase 2 [Dehalococcoidia bacterium]
MQLTIDQPFDLGESLESGQAHRWRKLEDGWYSGVLGPLLLHIRQNPAGAEYHVAGGYPTPNTAATDTLLRSYFRFDDDIDAIYTDICRDRRVAEMVARYRGLRILRQEPWECTVAFICSATSNIPRIHQNMEAMADSLGEPLELDGEVRHTFPSPEGLASAGEGFLRELGLGFRAPYVIAAARRVCDGELDLDELIRLPYPETKSRLMDCYGIGAKIADCIAVFSLEKLEAFPVDVWVRRALAEWYFPMQKKPPDRAMVEWAQEYFGQYAGYSQQYLFHGRRREGR